MKKEYPTENQITKQKLEWHFVSIYLDFLKTMASIKTDEEYQKRYLNLKEYVDKKISLESKTDVVDTYVVVEQAKV